jgi:hypothetical protein
VTSPWITLLETELLSWTELLISENTSQVLQRSGEMDQATDLMEVLPADMVASEQAGLSAERLSLMIRSFYASLVSSPNDTLLDQIQDPELRETVRRETAKKLLDAYRLVLSLSSPPLSHSLPPPPPQVYRTISDPKNGYGNARSQLLSHSVQEVSVLLGCSLSNH